MAGEDDGDVKARLYVAGLPFATTNSDLEALFGSYGPVKECFVVNEQESATSKGYGFVKFALKTDAATAKQQLDRSLYQGRRIVVSYALPKAKKIKRKVEAYSEDRPVEEEETAAAPSVPSSTQSSKRAPKRPVAQRAPPSTDNGRIVVVRGLAATVKKIKLKKKLGKYGKVMHVEYEETDGQLTANVLYETYEAAHQAAAKLEKGEVEGQPITAVLKSKDKPPSTKALLKSRLIVRNLSFKAQESDLLTAFEPHGEVVEVKLEKDSKGLPRGFAFVQYRNVFAAKKAIAAVNDTKIKERPVAVDFAVPKGDYRAAMANHQAPSQPEKKEDRAAAVTSPGSDAFDIDIDMNDEDEAAAQSNKEPAANLKARSGLKGDQDVTETESEAEESDTEDTGDVMSANEDKAQEENSPAVPAESKASAKQERESDVKQEKTVFIRNVSFEATEADIETSLAKFGPVAYVRLVRDKVTKRSRGTAFAKFQRKEDAQAFIDAAQDVLMVGTTLAAEGGVTINGRTVIASLAVERDEAARLQQEKTAAPQKEDKRSLYLSWEGYIKPGSAAAEGVSEEDMKRREKNMAEVRRKLKQPHYIVSQTRLVFKNVPTSVDEKRLKSVISHELKLAGYSPSVKKVIVMRNRTDDKRLGRSLGWAIVDFDSHPPALAALRAMNNNPQYFTPEKRLIVQFAVENTRALKILEQRQTQSKVERDDTAKPRKRLNYRELVAQKIKERKERQSSGQTGAAANVRPLAAAEASRANGMKAKKSKAQSTRTPPAVQSKRKIKDVEAVQQKSDSNAAHEQEDAGPKASLSRREKKRFKSKTADRKLDSLVNSYKASLGEGAAATLRSNRWFA